MLREVLEDYVLHTWRSATSTMWECVYRYDLDGDTASTVRELPSESRSPESHSSCCWPLRGNDCSPRGDSGRAFSSSPDLVPPSGTAPCF